MYPLPITSDDIFKYKILTGDIANPPEATNRFQMYLLALITGNKDVPQAVTRLDMYMRAAITNDIKIQDLPTPITRTDMYWYAIATGLHANIPEPITRADIFDYYLATESAIREWLEVSGSRIVIPNSKQGYTRELAVKGRTLQNLITKNYATPGDITFVRYLAFRKQGTFTIIRKTNRDFSASLKKMDGTWIRNTPLVFNNNIAIFTTIGEDCFDAIQTVVDSNYTIQQFLAEEIIVLEGDWTNKELPNYITGIESVGEKEGKVVVKSSDINGNIISSVEWVTEPTKGLPNGASDTIDKNGLRTDRVGKVVFNGTTEIEKWWGVQLIGSTYRYVLDIPNCPTETVRKPIVSDRFFTSVDSQVNIENLAFTSGGKIYLYKQFDTVDKFKAWLQANPVTVYYELATPTTKQLEKQNIAIADKGAILEFDNNVSGDITALVPVTGTI